jgi:suppressor of G2 allele of SKP1
MSTAAAKGADLINEKKYEEAIEQYSLALKTAQSPLWLIQRATAYQRAGKHAEALVDADAAFLAAKDRARRELMASAQFRRAVALHGLRRFGDARLCLTWCRKLNEKEKALGMWQAKVTADFEKAEQEGKLEEIETTVKECPDKVEVKKENDENKPPVSAASKDKGKGKEVIGEAPAPMQATPKEKVKHEWYQSATSITITIFAKGIPKDKAEINIQEGSVSSSFSPILPGTKST